MNTERAMEHELNNAVAADLDKIRQTVEEGLHIGQAKEAVAEKTYSGMNEMTELERFLANGEKLLEQQRQRLLHAESRYEVERVKLVDYFRVRMRNLEHEAHEALRSLDQRHAKKTADARKIFLALAAMREA